MALGLICAAALAVRIAYVLLLRHPMSVTGDAYQYHYGAILLAQGRGFINAYNYQLLGETRQTALHGPLYTVALAIPSAFGLRSPLGHQLWSSLMGTATVAVVGVIGRRIAGLRVGLLAAALAAVYPNLWVFDGLLAVETLSLLATALVLLAAYRFCEHRSTGTAAELGAACAIAALTRTEALLFLPLMVVPVAVTVARQPDSYPPRVDGAHDEQPGWRRAATLVVAAGLTSASLLGPWVAYNLSRFNNPVLISTPEVAIVAANCDDVYYGPAVGYWSSGCLPKSPAKAGDGTDDALRYRKVALDYVRANAGRAPIVAVARVGRTFALYRPLQQIRLDAYVEGRNPKVAMAGLVAYAVMVAASVPGAVVLLRRKTPLSPLGAIVATVAVTVALSYGQTRFRASAELVLVLLAAVSVDWLFRGGSGSPTVAGGARGR